jgi:WD40 repeat protein
VGHFQFKRAHYRSFATSGFDGAVRLWGADASGHQRLVTDLGAQTGSHPLAFSPDGKVLACGAETDIHLHDLESRTKTATIRNAHGESIVSLAFAPEGKTLFSAGESSFRIVREARGNQEALAESRPQLRLWDIAKGKMIREFVDAGFETGQCAAVLSHDGRILASMQANTILLWDVSTGKVTQRIPGYWVPSAASDKTLHSQYAIHSGGIAISPDCTTLACAHNPLHNVTLWDVATARRKIDFPDAHCESIEGISCSPDGIRIATGGGRDGTLRLWDSASGKPVRTFVIGDSFPCAVRCVAFSRDGKSVAAGGPNFKDGKDTGIVELWNVENGAIRLELRPGKDVAKVAFSHDGGTLAIATSNFPEFREDRSGRRNEARERTLLIIDAKSGAERRRIKLGGYVKALAFSSNGTTVSAVDDAGAMRTWDVATGQSTHQVAVRGQVFSAAIADDGTLAAISCLRREDATIWDLQQGKQLASIALGKGHLASVLAISPDNRVLASASIGGRQESSETETIQLWDLRSGRLFQRFSRPPSNRVQSMQFAPDSRRLISGMSDGTALVWDLSNP